MNEDIGVGLVIGAFVFGILLGSAVMFSASNESWQLDAVKTGHATYEANENGASEWRWKTLEEIRREPE